jgi:2,3-bisphosphoglycerate-independent phosphoglycerate mutase
MRVLMLFLDGVGIGVDDPAINPFFSARLPALRSLFDGGLPTLEIPFLQNGNATLVPLDANLGVDGLPQSGTGQTALFTGENAPRIIGKHFGPYPYSTLRPIIQEKNIFRRLKDANKNPYFANAYPQKFFDYFKDKQTRLTVTTLSCSYCAMPLHQVDTLEKGRAVSGDVTNAGWARMGYPHIAPIEAAEAGRRLAQLTHQHDFVLFEYWRTDKAGHSEKMNDAIESLELIDAMIRGIIESLDTRETLLLITSDHGNVEDMSTKVHTRNSVPAILFGHRHREVGEALLKHADLTSITPVLMQFIIDGERGNVRL